MENSKRKRKSTVRLSASMISDFLECPRKVYYRIYYPELAEKTDALILGTVVHEAVEKYWDDFLAAIEYINTQDISDKIKEKAARMVSNYFDGYLEMMSDDDLVEKYINFEVNGIPFIAKIDRIINNLQDIVDWKTSKKAKASGIETDIQALVYKKAFEKEFERNPRSILFINLNLSKISGAKVESSFEDYFWDRLVPFVYEEITNERFPATGWYKYYQPCKFCTYRKVCKESIFRSEQ